ncbi:MAG: sarcosine oxidase subunit gamma family protein [Usitatibacter sp.]
MDEPISIVERTGLAMVQVSTWPDSDAAARSCIAGVVGLELPPGANTAAMDGPNRILWLGPHRWLVVAPLAPDRDLAAELAAGLPPAIAAVVDVGAGRQVLQVSGSRTRDLLAKELPIDLHPSAFPVGHCVQGSMAHVGVLIHALAANTFDIFVYRAFARHLREMLEDAATEYATSCVP